jgi:hypothetical protein
MKTTGRAPAHTRRPVLSQHAVCRRYARQARCGSGYPVASASLPRSGPGGRGPDGAPDALNDLDPCPPVRYAFGADGTGYPLPLVTHHLSGEPPRGAIPE